MILWVLPDVITSINITSSFLNKPYLGVKISSILDFVKVMYENAHVESAVNNIKCAMWEAI